MDTIMQGMRRIETEFEEPLLDVVSGYAEMGYSKALIASTLEVSEPSLRMYSYRRGIRFRHSPLEHREIKGRPGRRIRHGNTVRNLSEWALELGVAPCTIHKRLRTRGRVA